MCETVGENCESGREQGDEYLGDTRGRAGPLPLRPARCNTTSIYSTYQHPHIPLTGAGRPSPARTHASVTPLTPPLPTPLTGARGPRHRGVG